MAHRNLSTSRQRCEKQPRYVDSKEQSKLKTPLESQALDLVFLFLCFFQRRHRQRKVRTRSDALVHAANQGVGNSESRMQQTRYDSGRENERTNEQRTNDHIILFAFFIFFPVQTADALNHAGQFQRCVDDLRHNLVCFFFELLLLVLSCSSSFREMDGDVATCSCIAESLSHLPLFFQYSELNTKCYLPVREFVKEDIQAAKVWFSSSVLRSLCTSHRDICLLLSFSESEKAVRCGEEQIRVGAEPSQVTQSSEEHPTHEASNGEESVCLRV